MSNEKLKIISLSMENDLHDQLKISSKRMDCSVSYLVRELVRKHLCLIANENDETPVILKVPNELKGDELALRRWLEARTNAIVNALT